MNIQFKRIGLISKPNAHDISPTIHALCTLLIELGIKVYIDPETACHTDLACENIVHIEDLAKRCDLVISIGGDGTLLSAARTLVNSHVPLVGINLGRLGFLVDISPVDIAEKIQQVLCGEYHEEERIILNIQIIRNGRVVHQQPAFN